MRAEGERGDERRWSGKEVKNKEEKGKRRMKEGSANRKAGLGNRLETGRPCLAATLALLP